MHIRAFNALSSVAAGGVALAAASCQHLPPPMHNATDSTIRVVVTAPPQPRWATLGLQSTTAPHCYAAIIEPGATSSSSSWQRRKAQLPNDRVGFRVEISSIVNDQRAAREVWLAADEFRGSGKWVVRRDSDGFSIARE